MSGQGKVAIVTGANCGLGFAVTKVLCAQSYEVILACRSEQNGNEAVSKIVQENPNAKATFMQLDLADMASVRRFVDQFHDSGRSMDVLINNAGISLSFQDKVRQVSKDNFELTMATNHMGHFLLTHLLLDDLKSQASKTKDVRVVVVTSSLHDQHSRGWRKQTIQPLVLDNLMLEKESSYSGGQAYKNSKLANILFTSELARQLSGTGVTVNCVCPGFIPETNFVRNASGMSRIMVRYLLKPIFWLTNTTRTVDQGAAAIVDLATSETVKEVTGKYFNDMKECESSAESQNAELQKGLWELSSQLCQLHIVNGGPEPGEKPTGD